MMNDHDLAAKMHERSEALIGKEAVDCLKTAHVAVFGLGGVGSWAAEALARSAVGCLRLVDGDIIEASNINRQLPALASRIGETKVSVMAARLKEINPQIEIECFPEWYRPRQSLHLLAAIPASRAGHESRKSSAVCRPEAKSDVSDCEGAPAVHRPEAKSDNPVDGGASAQNQGRPDFILDAIDDLPAKIDLIVQAQRLGIPILSAGGCGRRFDPSALVLGDLYETAGDPLCRILRRELRKRGVFRLRMVYSREAPLPVDADRPSKGPASMIFVPASAGLLMAADCVRQILANPPPTDRPNF